MNDAELREELARQHQGAFAWSMCCCRRDVSLAESALQSAYLKVLEGRAVFRGQSSFRTWLFGVIRRTAMEERRRAFIRRIVFIGPDAPPTPEEIGARSEMQQRLVAALRKLADRQREVLELVFYHDMTLDDAANVMRVSPGAARTHYARGKARLRELLSEVAPESRRSRPADAL